jgi:hypothetical protein
MGAILPCVYALPRRDALKAFTAARRLLPDFGV